MEPRIKIDIEIINELKELIGDIQLTMIEINKKIEKLNTFQLEITTETVYERNKKEKLV
ncbi:MULTISPECIES: hypothetical protein [unclassified Granulicatella]|uniref:hypothetical protein n=1 Tax=unclassified Granulicatella TaxID=2630493 RepID=UPI001430E5B9|nr:MULTISPECIES: hypothetical protein [unclassified Granulicatella]MBF0781151.1 hypothetical protein [Granulicatella sp. 19428wC4_WM01]